MAPSKTASKSSSMKAKKTGAKKAAKKHVPNAKTIGSHQKLLSQLVAAATAKPLPTTNVPGAHLAIKKNKLAFVFSSAKAEKAMVARIQEQRQRVKEARVNKKKLESLQSKLSRKVKTLEERLQKKKSTSGGVKKAKKSKSKPRKTDKKKAAKKPKKVAKSTKKPKKAAKKGTKKAAKKL